MAEIIHLETRREQTPTRKVLTAPGGMLEASARLRRCLAIFEGGRILATPAALDDPEFQALQRQAAIAKISLHEPELASLDEIAAANANVVNVEEYATQARQALLAILARAARNRASDILIARSDDQAVIRLRVNGLMRDDRKLDPEQAIAISNAAFNLCNSGDSLASTTRAVRAAITNRKLLPPDVLGVRLQYAPTATGFALIMRLAYMGAAIGARSLEHAGFDDKKVIAIRAAVQSSAGVFLVAGPTEHGKSTTLNLAIEEFARSFVQAPNIVAVEDPPETQHIPYIQTFSVNTSIESEATAFETALLAALRLAPDGIKIGELRDHVSASTAYRAAGSGAMVFATLHTGYATDIPFRVIDLGVERFRAFDKLNVGWLAQRLLPKVCNGCSIPARQASRPAHQALLATAEQMNLQLAKARFVGPGCDRCGQTGYHGRVLVSEFVTPDTTLLEFGLKANTTRQAFRRAWLRNGGYPLTIAGFSLVREGQVSLDSFVRTVGPFSALNFDVENVGPTR